MGGKDRKYIRYIKINYTLINTTFIIHSQPKFGVEAGGIYNEMFTSNIEVCPKFSYRVGGFVNYGEILSSGISYVRKSVEFSKFLPQYTDYIQKLDVAMDYIELVPLSIKFGTLDINRNFKITPMLSLYGRYGFAGKVTITGLGENGNTFDKTISNPFKNSEFEEGVKSYPYKGFKNFDAGGKIGFDFAYKDNYILRLNYSAGLLNISSYDKKFRNGSLDLSLCYLFQ